MINVIGGAGFIGTRLCQRLESSKKNFNILDKNDSFHFTQKTRKIDVRDLESLSSEIFGDVIVLLAAEHRDDVFPKSLYKDVNVKGAENVCKVAREKGVNKIIFTSSVAVYGFAPLDTGEDGNIAPFNDYGKTKYEAELILKQWQNEEPENRTLIIVRPTVVFGERNRGNVFNLLKQIASGKFVMIGKGLNRKSMAYVENVAAFIEYSIGFNPGVHVYNYIDKPDFNMNQLVSMCNKKLRGKERVGFRLPYLFGLVFGKFFDILAFVTGKKFAISSIRVKKFCADSAYSTSIGDTGFAPPVDLIEALNNTLRYEFLEDNSGQPVFETE